MRLAYLTHQSFARHMTGPNHPERPIRLQAVDDGVKASGVEVVAVEPLPASVDMLSTVHDPDYAEAIHQFCLEGGGYLDPDTVASPGSWEAALRAAGAGATAVTVLESGLADYALAAVRPPGHHALRTRAMGFCLFNNVAVAARWLQMRGEKVAIIDWDVHHGNGTQDEFFEDPDVLYVSFHQYPFYPGSGNLNEVGAGPGLGATLNFPWPAGTGGDVYRAAFEQVLTPVLIEFAPAWVLVSAGYDAHAADPLAELRLHAADYNALAATVAKPARTIVFLEGGYDLTAIAESVAATLHGLEGRDAPSPTERSSQAAWDVLDRAQHEFSRWWHL